MTMMVTMVMMVIIIIILLLHHHHRHHHHHHHHRHHHHHHYQVSATSACQTESITVPICTTTSGPRPGQSCVFPFRHLGIVYNACTSVGQSAPWCSTSTTSAGTHIDGEYGFCPSTCPSDTTSSVT